MQVINHKVYLYKPNGTSFLGELIVDNLKVDIKLQDISTIAFRIPEVINAQVNPRVDEVLDSYIIELWYGKVDGVYANGDFEKIRFRIYSTPLDFSDYQYLHSYSGYSLQSDLEFKQIVSWRGVQVKDFFRTITYNNNASTPRFTETGITPYTISTSSNTSSTKYITIPTTGSPTALDIFIYEKRTNSATSTESEVSLIELTSGGVNSNDFKAGYYHLNKTGDIVNSVSIALPYSTEAVPTTGYNSFNGSETATFSYRFYHNPVSRAFAVGIKTNTETPLSNMYIDLAQAAGSGPTAVYGGYTFTSQSIYSKNGLKLNDILTGLDTSSDGILYNTGFTVGTISNTIAAKYRSNIDFNNITVHQAIKDVAESFEAIPVFDSINKTVSFYAENEYGSNNGLMIKYATYLKSINKEIDASKIITNARGLGKDNIKISLVNPTGSEVWEDYSYFLDDYHIEDTTGFTIVASETTGLTITYASTADFQSRWMDAAEALKVAKWQYTRDYFHTVLSSASATTVDASHNQYKDLYNLRSAAINLYVKYETQYEKKKADEYKYYYLVEHYRDLFENKGTNQTEYDYYREKYADAVAQTAAFKSTVLDPAYENIYDVDTPGTLAYKFDEIQSFLNKTTWTIDLDKLRTFEREAVHNDSKIDTEYDLLDSTKIYVDENKEPRITFNIGIIDVLEAQEAYQDWDKFVIGDKINIYFPEFNIDLEAQIREISIDFQGKSLSIVISTVRNYNRSFGSYLTKNIRRFHNANLNTVLFYKDGTDASIQDTNIFRDTFENGINAGNTTVSTGAVDGITGQSSTTTTGEGQQSRVVTGVDLYTESLLLSAFNQGIKVTDGRILTFRPFNVEGVQWLQEVEVSAENGFVIRRVYANDVVTKLAYIDASTGSAFFAGWKLDPGQFSAGSGSSFVGINSETPVASNTLYAFWAGSATPSAAPFSVTKSGTLVASSATITGAINATSGTFNNTITIGTNDTNKISIIGASTAAGTKIFSGTGTWSDSNTGFYLDAAGKFSLGNQLYWDPSANEGLGDLQILGNLVADTGTIGGFTITDDTIQQGADTTKFVIQSNANNPFISIKQATNGFNENGIFLGIESSFSKLSLVGSNSSLSFNGQALAITGGSLTVGTNGVGTGSVVVDGAGIYGYYDGNTSTPTLKFMNSTGRLEAVDIFLQAENKTTEIGNLTGSVAGDFGLEITNNGGYYLNKTDIAFTAATKTISSTTTDLSVYKKGNKIVVTGSVSNNNIFTAAEDGLLNSLEVEEALINESAGTTLTIGRNQPYKVSVTDEGFFILTVNSLEVTDTAMSVRYDSNRIWAKRLLISDVESEEGASVVIGTIAGNTQLNTPATYGVITKSGDNIAYMTAEGFKIVQDGEETFKVQANGTITAETLVIRGTSTLGGWTVDNDSVSAGEFILQHDATNPYLSIKQGEDVGWYDPTLTSPASEKYGIFLGYDSNAAKMSLASATNYLVWDGSDLLLKGNLSGEISAINIDNVTIDANGIRAQIDGSSPALYSFYLNADDGTGGIAGWEIDSNNITSETNKVQLQKEGKILVGGSTVDGNGDVNNATLIIDGTATGESPVLDHANFELRADGSAIFSGALIAATGSFTGSIAIGTENSIFKADSNGIYLGDADFIDAEFSVTPEGAIKATSGEIGGFTLGSSFLRAGTVTGTAVGISPSIANNISFYAGAATTSSNPPTNDEINAAPFRVTKTGVLNATGAIIEGTITATDGRIGSTTDGWDINANVLESKNDYIKLDAANNRINVGNITLQGDATGSNSYIGLNKTSYALSSTSGIYLGLDNSVAKFSIGANTGNSLTWDGSSLGIVGDIGGTIGNITVGQIVISSTGINTTTNKFSVDSGTGLLTAVDGNFSGTITSTAGSIGSYNINANSINSRLISKATFENDESSTGDNYNGWVRSGTWVRSTSKAYAGSHSMSRYMIDNTPSALTYTFTKPQTSNVFLKFAHQFSDGSPTSFVVRKNGSTVFTVNSSSFTVNTWNIFQQTIAHSGVDINTIEIFTTSSTGPTPTLFIDEIELFEGSSIPNNYVNLSRAGLYLPDVSLDKFGLIANAGKVGPLLISNENAPSKIITSGFTSQAFDSNLNTINTINYTNFSLPSGGGILNDERYLVFTFDENKRFDEINFTFKTTTTNPTNLSITVLLQEGDGTFWRSVTNISYVFFFSTADNGVLKNISIPFKSYGDKLRLGFSARAADGTGFTISTFSTEFNITNFKVIDPVFNLQNKSYIYNDGLIRTEELYVSKLSIKERSITSDDLTQPIALRSNKIQFGNSILGFDVESDGLAIRNNLYGISETGRTFAYAPWLVTVGSVTFTSNGQQLTLTGVSGYTYNMSTWLYLRINRAGIQSSGIFFRDDEIGISVTGGDNGPWFTLTTTQATNSTSIAQVSIRRGTTGGSGNTFVLRYNGASTSHTVTLFRVKNTA